MAGKHRATVSLLVYLVFFAIALRFYFLGRHVLALGIVVTVWAVLTAWLRFGGGK